MAHVTVYRFRFYDIAEDASRLSPSWRTEAEIRRLGFEPVPATAREVDEADLDEDGRFRPAQDDE